MCTFWMNMNIIKKEIKLNDGRVISIETGKLAKQADGSVVVRMGDTMLLATVVSAKDAREGVDFLPLSVDYQEKFAAAGKIPGGFFKREGRLSDYEVLVSRLIDRVLRPLFPSDYHAETQVMVQLISHGKDDMPDALAGLAASAAIMTSDLPFNGPISEVRVGRVNGEWVINPSISQMNDCDIELMVGASADSVMMVEGEMNEVSEAEMLEAIKVSHDAIKEQCAVQAEIAKELGITIREYSHENSDEALAAKIKDFCYDKCYAVAKKGGSKPERKEGFAAVKQEFLDSLSEEELEGFDSFLIGQYFHDVEKEAVRRMILDENQRLDGRKLNEVRNIWSEVDYLPSAHGSAVFTRGETQSLTSVTLGTKLDEKMVDGAVLSGYDKFILHYNFPSFSVGEARPNRGPGRREVGHGNLALRALKKVLPEENPYTVRVVSDILESNGSSSMATVCAGSLALMDAGINIKSSVSGIAMGLITDGEKYAVLSDILGDEDHLGDMDFKVTGTAKGITACQMDIKVNGLSYEILENALNQAKEGRDHIRMEMEKTISTPNADYKPHAPRMIKFNIPNEFIGAVIGPGGKIIQDIQATTGATVTIEEDDNTGEGIVSVSGTDGESVKGAEKRIKDICAVPEVGETYDSIVKSIMPYGAFVEFMPGKQGLLHISEIKWERLEKMDGIFEEGEEVKVKLLGIDKKSGKFKLSRKVLLPKPEAKEEA